MGFLEDFRRMIAGDEVSGNRMAAEAFKYASIAFDSSYHRLFSDAVLPWFERMSLAVPGMWFHPAVRRQCDMSLHTGRCHARAATMCSVCKRNVCLSHAYVCVDASVVCLGCVTEVRKHVQPVINATPGPDEWARKEMRTGTDPAELKRAYKVLGIDPEADEEITEAAYKRLLRRWHPDRVDSVAKKQQYEQKFKQVRWAYDLVQKQRKAG